MSRAVSLSSGHVSTGGGRTSGTELLSAAARTGAIRLLLNGLAVKGLALRLLLHDAT